MDISRDDREALIRDKYDGDQTADLTDDIRRLSEGEPLAYVIGWIPFMGLRISLDSHPLIPRPETEWWTELLVRHLSAKYDSKPFSFLDLCAGSGAIGLAVLKHFPAVTVSFGELVPEHAELIRKNIELNKLDATRAHIHTSDLFETFGEERFNLIACNPPYIPNKRTLDASVTEYEPPLALFSGKDGLDLIKRIAKEAPHHLQPGGELWIECDIENIAEAADLLPRSEIRTDQYGRPRLLMGYYD